MVCPVYRESGSEVHTARGKHHLGEVIDSEKISPVYEDLFSQCLLCGRCSQVCAREIDTPLSVVRARSGFSTFYGQHGYVKFLARKLLNHPSWINFLASLGSRTAEKLKGVLPQESGLRLKLGLFQQELIGSRSEVNSARLFSTGEGKTITYFPGCVSRYLYQGIMDKTAEVFSRAGSGLLLPEGLECCGMAAWAAGDLKGARQLAMRNIEVLEKQEGRIVVTCGSCFHQLHQLSELFEDSGWKKRAENVGQRLVMLSQFLNDHPITKTGQDSTAQTKKRIFYHDPCHLLTVEKAVDGPREVLSRIPGVELVELEGGPSCCGHGGLFSLGAPELSENIRHRLVDGILNLKPDIITTSCSGCLMQLRMGMLERGAGVEVLEFAELLSRLTSDRHGSDQRRGEQE